MKRDVGSRDIRKNDLLSKINVFIPPCEDNITRDGRNVDFRFADTLSPLDDLGFGSDRSVLSDIESDSQTAQAFRILSDIGDVFINIGKTRTPTRKSILLAIGPIGTGRCLPIIGGIVSPSDAIVSFQDRAVVVDPCDRVGLLSKGLPSGHEIQIGLDRSRCREKPVRLLHSRIPPQELIVVPSRDRKTRNTGSRIDLIGLNGSFRKLPAIGIERHDISRCHRGRPASVYPVNPPVAIITDNDVRRLSVLAVLTSGRDIGVLIPDPPVAVLANMRR